VYLEPIFGAGTLSQDQTRFRRVDQDFRSIMRDVAQESKVVSLCRISNLHQILHTLLDQLSRCQKSLNDFLEVSIFASGNISCLCLPLFFFVIYSFLRCNSYILMKYSALVVFSTLQHC